MRRRSTLKLGTLAVGATAASVFPAPAIAQGLKKLRLATTWPKNFPGLDDGAKRFAENITQASEGRITVEVYSAGELVPAFDVFDAVARGEIDLYHGSESYWFPRNRLFSFFASVPLGLTANEMDAWLTYGRGQEIWDRLSGDYGIKPLLCGNTGVQMAGWFQNEITNIAELSRLTYRIAGLGAEVLQQIGTTTLTVPGGEILDAMRSRRIDACEFIGPWVDSALGLHRVARYYYYPGMHAPGEAVSVGVNLKLWEELLSPSDRRIFTMAARCENNILLSEFNAQNGLALRNLITAHGVQVRRFDRLIFRELSLAARDVLEGVGNESQFARRTYNNFIEFRREVARWTELSDQAYVEARSRYI